MHRFTWDLWNREQSKPGTENVFIFKKKANCTMDRPLLIPKLFHSHVLTGTDPGSLFKRGCTTKERPN